MIAVVIWFARQKTDRKDFSGLQPSDEEADKFQQFLSRESNRQ